MLRIPAQLEIGPFTIHLDVLMARLQRRRRRIRRVVLATVMLVAVMVAGILTAPLVRGRGVAIIPEPPAGVQLSLNGQPVGSGAVTVPSGSHSFLAERSGAFPASQIIQVTRDQTVTLELPHLRPIPLLQQLPLPDARSTWMQVSADASGGWRLQASRPAAEASAGARPGWGPQPLIPPLVLHLDRQGLTRLSVLESYPVADEMLTAAGERFWAMWSEPTGPKLPGIAGLLTLTTPVGTDVISTTGALRGLWWAPGGRSLLVALPHDQGQDLAVLDPRRPTSALTPLITVPGTVKSVHWHPDGRAAVVLTAIDPPAPTGPQAAPRPGPTQPPATAETSALAYNAVLLLLPDVGTATATRLRVPPVRAAGLLPLTWTDDALWWVTDTGLGLALDRVYLATGMSERRGTLPSGLVALTVLPDGNTVRLVCALPDDSLRVERWPEGDALFTLPGVEATGPTGGTWLGGDLLLATSPTALWYVQIDPEALR